MTHSSGYLQFIKDNLPFLAAGFLLSFMSGLGQTYFISIFGGEIRSSFGLSNGDWGLLYMCSTGLSAVAMVYAGTLADTYRIRSLSIAIFAVLCASCVLLATAQSLTVLAIVIFFLRFAGQGMAGHIAIVAMSRWFVATRGRAVAIASLGFMFGEATMPLTMVWLKSFVDWRTLWVCFSVFTIAMVPVIWWLLSKERVPSAVAAQTESVGMAQRNWTRKEAVTHPMFWYMVPAIGLFPAFGTAFWFHQAHFAEIKGWTHLQLVSVFPLGTVALALSTIAYGWLIDRFGAIRLLPFYLSPLAIAFVLHWAATDVVVTAIAVVLMGIAGGGQATVLAACWSELYGTRYIGSIKAAVAAVMVAGSAVGPGLTGALIDNGISFEVQNLFIAFVFVLTCLSLFPIRRHALAATS